MSHVLVPIFVCVVLPVSIVLIVCLARMNSDNIRAKVLIKAIENNKDVDADKLAEALSQRQRTPRELLNLRLLRGSIFSLVGVLFAGVSLFGYLNGAEATDDPVCIPLLLAAASLAVGISYLVVYFVTRKDVDREDKNCNSAE